jgi:DNA-binding NarL/FixJ family response regulator
VRQALRALLEKELGVQVAAETASGIETIGAVKQHRPTVLVLDFYMPHGLGVEVLVEARRWSPDTRIIVLTGSAKPAVWRELVASGAEGVFLKSGEPADLRHGFATILAGGRAYSDAIGAAILQVGDAPVLTLRERQILSAVARGQTNAEIARTYGIAPKTVDNHRTHIMSKLDVHSVAELIGYALREGLLDPSQNP